MTASEGIEKIKKLLFGEVPPTPPAPAVPAPAQMTDVKTTDGKALVIDTMAVGGNVLLEGVAAPDAEYQLEDGSSLTVAGGMITAITPKAVEPAEEMATPAQMQAALQKFADGTTDPAMQKMTVILKAVFENVFGWQLREAQQKATVDQAIATYQQGFAKQEQANKLIIETLEGLSNQSIVPPVTKVEAFEKETPLTNYQKLLKNRGEL
jgi:hypothetical protein